LITAPVKLKRNIEIKSDNKESIISSEPFKKAEKERLGEILKLLSG